MTSRGSCLLALLNIASWLPACPGGGAADPSTGTTDPGDPASSTTDITPTTATTQTTALSTTDTPTSGGPACTAADCRAGEFCDGAFCMPGCDGPEDCTGATHCDLATNHCVDCLEDTHCPEGQVCDATTCILGCADGPACQDGFACCDDHCADPQSDPLHCGGCDPCPALANAESQCQNGSCALATCLTGFADCDADPGNGCESAVACVCTPGEQVPCYSGPMGTEGLGKCLAGVRTCAPDGLALGACTGEVLPDLAEQCGNAIDDDCDGATDDLDADGDGYSACTTDCCDLPGPDCPTPDQVNPGAFEILGNTLDDDCDPTTLDNVAPPDCNIALASDSADPFDYARAIDLCTFTSDDLPPDERTWGVLSAALTRADGVQPAYPDGAAIRGDLGPNVQPKKGQRLAMLSTGNAADPNDTNPAFAPFQPGLVTGLGSPPPADWLTANGGTFPPSPGCPAPDDTTAHDSIMLTLRVRVPTNARSFSLDMDFFSADWPEWVCTAHNDLFVALLDSQAPGTPADKNIAVHIGPDQVHHPVRVDLALVSVNAFDVCFTGEVGCMGTPITLMNACPGGTLELIGTGFFQNGDTGCPGNNTTGGATGWRTMSANVVPGETIELRLAIWNTADGLHDSAVLLDRWRWSTTPTTLGLKK